MIADNNLRIEGRQVFLRKLTSDDAAKIFRMSVEDGMKRWIPDQVYQDLNEAREVLDFLIEQYSLPDGPARVPIVLGVCLLQDGELIGHAGLSPAAGEVEIGYAVEESQQNRGYASDAVKACCQWAKDYYRLPRILGIVASENLASCRVLEKAGFTLSEEKERIMHEKMKMARVYSF